MGNESSSDKEAISVQNVAAIRKKRISRFVSRETASSSPPVADLCATVSKVQLLRSATQSDDIISVGEVAGVVDHSNEMEQTNQNLTRTKNVNLNNKSRKVSITDIDKSISQKCINVNMETDDMKLLIQALLGDDNVIVTNSDLDYLDEALATILFTREKFALVFSSNYIHRNTAVFFLFCGIYLSMNLESILKDQSNKEEELKQVQCIQTLLSSHLCTVIMNSNLFPSMSLIEVPALTVLFDVFERCWYDSASMDFLFLKKYSNNEKFVSSREFVSLAAHRTLDFLTAECFSRDKGIIDESNNGRAHYHFSYYFRNSSTNMSSLCFFIFENLALRLRMAYVKKTENASSDDKSNDTFLDFGSCYDKVMRILFLLKCLIGHGKSEREKMFGTAFTLTESFISPAIKDEIKTTNCSSCAAGTKSINQSSDEFSNNVSDVFRQLMRSPSRFQSLHHRPVSRLDLQNLGLIGGRGIATEIGTFLGLLLRIGTCSSNVMGPSGIPHLFSLHKEHFIGLQSVGMIYGRNVYTPFNVHTARTAMNVRASAKSSFALLRGMLDSIQSSVTALSKNDISIFYICFHENM